MYRNTCSINYSESYILSPTLFVPFGLGQASGPSHRNTERREHPHGHTHVSHKSHLFLLLRNEPRAKLLKTGIMAVTTNCIVQYLSGNKKFPNFYLQFSPKGFPISYTEFGHIFTPPEAPLEILPNLKSQPPLQMKCCRYLAKNMALQRCKHILNNCPLPHCNRRGCGQASMKQLLIQNRHCKEL